MSSTLSDSRLASVGARAICDAFEKHQETFQTITRRARAHFEKCDWRAMQNDATARLDLYTGAVTLLLGELRCLLESRTDDKAIWSSMKAVYSGLIASRDDLELAETFFNSVTRRIFTTVGVDPQIEFVDSDFNAPFADSALLMSREYAAPSTPLKLVETVLKDFAFTYEDSVRDAQLAAEAIENLLRSRSMRPVIERARFLRSIFYRGKGAYIIGQMSCDGTALPLVLALQNGERGVVLDAVLFTEDEVSILFSFTRSYFHADVSRPREMIRFLREIMPRKPLAELYIAVGFNKHGKTEFYRHFLRHMNSSDDQFIIAPGARGMVMLVFTLPSYDAVFKIIRDTFDAPKTSTRAEVMGKYRLVFKHDRAGRLIDAQEFEHLEFDRARFSEPLLEQMSRNARDTVRVDGERVVIKHLYIERRLRPLDIFVREADEAAVREAVIDYGRAIKDLAAANIFPGDVLIKNFGVTRHGRIVSYDYDELCHITDCRFRAVPKPHNAIEEMSAEPWYFVGEHDCFPAEFKTWLGLDEPWRSVYLEHHADLYEVSFWQKLQERIRAGELIDIPPYPESKRLRASPKIQS